MSFNDPDPTSPTRPGNSSDPPPSYALSGKIMLTAIIVIFFIVILMVSLHLYSRWYLLRSRRRFQNRRATTLIFFSDTSESTTARSVTTGTTPGLDPSVIKSLPIFTFSAAFTGSDPVECAVCLSEFKETESGRILPNCKHTFHVDCIDMWFHSHSSCPLCRSLVEPLVKSTAEEIVISISYSVSGDDRESRSGLRENNTDRIESYAAETSAISISEDSRRKPAVIEVPRRNPGEIENDFSQSFRSPMSRVLSFTRILSRERRSGSSSIVSPPVSSVTVTELVIEREGEETR